MFRIAKSGRLHFKHLDAVDFQALKNAKLSSTLESSLLLILHVSTHMVYWHSHFGEGGESKDISAPGPRDEAGTRARPLHFCHGVNEVFRRGPDAVGAFIKKEHLNIEHQALPPTQALPQLP